ncbi:MAG: hypothetical protein PHY93_06705 [Bacteriovorax sp.]|nr:hypothetical protein [Bacteriovorax sp.]
MKILILALVTLLSLSAFSDSNKEKREEKKNGNKEEKSELDRHPKPLSVFDVIPLNSPVKESVAKFLLKMPVGLEIDEVKYKVKNASRLFEKDKPHQKIDLVDGPQGKELHISVSRLPPGFYQLFVKVRDRKNKEHEFKTKYKDHAMFVVDSSLQVPVPNEKENNKTVAGVDSDGDGIRDDIQRWINEEFSSQPKVKMAMKQMAMGRQLDLLSVSIREQSIIASNKYLNDAICLSSIVGIDQKSKLNRELDSKLLNTKNRLYADMKANANFSGQAWDLPNTPEERKALCAFNPDNF